VIRTIWSALNALIATLFIGTILIGASVVRIKGDIYDWGARNWSRWILWASGVTVKVEGLANVHMDEPQVIVSNHQSWYDVWALAANIPKRYRFIAKKELGYIPVFGTAWKVAGHISVDRSDHAAAVRSLDQAGDLIRNDQSSIVIFPEGTRSDDGKLKPFKKGAFMLALHSGVEIVPVACVGTRAILPKNGWRVRGGTIIVRFGEPIQTTGYDEDNRDELIGRVRGEIERLMGNHTPEHTRTGK
jgi:1-acyl-sn-glycerol-3-phosphate acyltransferase